MQCNQWQCNGQSNGQCNAIANAISLGLSDIGNVMQSKEGRPQASAQAASACLVLPPLFCKASASAAGCVPISHLRDSPQRSHFGEEQVEIQVPARHLGYPEHSRLHSAKQKEKETHVRFIVWKQWPAARIQSEWMKNVYDYDQLTMTESGHKNYDQLTPWRHDTAEVHIEKSFSPVHKCTDLCPKTWPLYSSSFSHAPFGGYFWC